MTAFAMFAIRYAGQQYQVTVPETGPGLALAMEWAALVMRELGPPAPMMGQMDLVRIG